ncbi:hypothetical protein EDD95_8064 [Streptomyces sp. CEV 2-1]|uniref:hypothetical protein n=1 Tax=Streptomyces sp. CEV 2-1 TaxID=2485153 RepID=UPI000F4A10EB|nr:hypothetical protein [Streptomyces sp. CEV 2-1]ROQ65210.1 hypothetical protein EDD95_8064 [Streptomyces sp. CEV 2-1]
MTNRQTGTAAKTQAAPTRARIRTADPHVRVRVRAVRGVKRWLRPGRSMVAGLVLLAVSCLASLVLAAAVASAAPSPTPAPSPSVGPTLPGPDNPLDPSPLVPSPEASGRADDQPLMRDAEKEARKKEKASRTEFERRVAQYKKDRAVQGGVLSAFEVSDRDGNPVSSYRIYADTGDWKDWDLSVDGFLVEMLFLGNKWLVSFACFLISWSLSFSLAGLMLKPALQVSTSLYGGVVTQLGLPLLFLTFTLVVASWHLLFGNRVRGWGEMAAALVISALALGALASPPQLLLSKDSGVVGTVRNLAVETAALVLDKEAIDTTRPTTDTGWEKKATGSTVGAQVRSAPSALARPVTDALVDAFVARPAMLLSYGRTFDGACGKRFRDSRIQQAVFDQMIDKAIASPQDKTKSALKYLPGAFGLPVSGPVKNWLIDTTVDVTTAQVREQLEQVGPIKAFEKACVKDAGTLKKASMDKVGGAAFMLLAAFLTCAFITVLACAFLFAQLQIALEAMIAKVALAAGILPGPGRAWLWQRAAAIARSLALMVASVASLAVFIVVVNTVLNAPESDLPGGVTVRFIVLDGVCVAAFLYRRKLAHSTRGMVARARHGLGNTPLGGAASPTPGPKRQGGLGKGLLLGGLALGAAFASGGTGAVLGAGGRIGGAKLSAGLGSRLAHSGGRAALGLTRLTGRTVETGAKTAVKAGVLGLKATAGLPVYGPRAARRVGPAMAGLPGRAAAQVTRAAEQLQDSAQEMNARVQPARAFVGEYRHNVRSLGRIVRGQPGLGAYQPTTPPPRPAPPTVPTARRVSAPGTRQPIRTANPAPNPAPAPVVVRRRPAPPRTVQPPTSAAQARLQQQLHRVRQPHTTDLTPPPPRAPQSPRAAGVRQPRAGRRPGPGQS